ncbi:hypothetical protein BDN71DRAFT_1500164 [Pleurotus eryngii]|uniref:SUN domain-containing protein n=1 Tax=Pleurotus eryngii TaxID=5323 RepID=A0A9P6D8J6_PLEER|nr:hypothetical protein BDN71DRAFT_1500164 [Pleurotus eryngii]
MVTLFLAAPSPFTPNPQPTNPASASVSPSIHHSLLAGATFASIPPRNLALFGGGARVNYFLTSATYDPHGAHSVGVLRSSLRWVRDTVLEVEFSRLHMSRPRDALSENMELGRCWEFEGSAGHIAIELPDVGTITHVSVAYVPVSLLSQAAAGRAPRGVTIWGLVNATTAEHFSESRPPSSFTTSHKDPPGILPSDRFIRLGEFVFDINASLRHQFFAIDPDATTVKTSLVVVEVNSNHGSSTTCLYYLGVYGLVPIDNISLVGWPHSERTYVEVLYTDDSGQECVCHFGALVMHKNERLQVFLPFFEDEEYFIRIKGSSEVCLAGIKLVVDCNRTSAPVLQWPKYVAERELVATSTLKQEKGTKPMRNTEDAEKMSSAGKSVDVPGPSRTQASRQPALL